MENEYLHFQLDPEGTSKGMWRVGNGTEELFGRSCSISLHSSFEATGSLCRFARRFDQESDLHTMRFQLNRWTTHDEGK